MAKLSKKEQEKGMAFLAALVQQQGLDITAEELNEEVAGADVKRQIKTLQAEGVLLFLQGESKLLEHKVCKECKSFFATRYTNVAYCSDSCRADALRRMGIKWDSSRDSYAMLGSERPILVGAQTYQFLLDFAHAILDGSQEIRVLQEEEETPLPEPQIVDLPPLSLGEPDQTTPLPEPVVEEPPVKSGPPLFDSLEDFVL